jgi:hypothetical protein
VTAADELARGRHESYESYDSCRKRQRRSSLYSGGQNLNENLGAAATRQNPNGGRFGLECPEERDYYPYWHPTEWKDIVIFASDADKRCPLYRKESQNVVPKGYCNSPKLAVGDPNVPPTLPQAEQIPNTPQQCGAQPGEQWLQAVAWDIDPPECYALPDVADNMQGNMPNGKSQSYMWRIPEDIFDGDTCVLRVRYNISSGDLNMNPALRNSQDPDADDGAEFDYFFDLDAKFNAPGAQPALTNEQKDFIGLGWNVAGPLQMQVDQNHWGRTFEDRSHTFTVRAKPEALSGVKIINYNVRGKRGTQTQVYPATTYEFVPPDLVVNQGDFLHFQWTGSDSNPNNAGHGKQGTDRTNLVQIESRATNRPVPLTKHTLFYDGFNVPAFECANGPGKIVQTCHGHLWASCGRCPAQGQALMAKMAFLDQQTYATFASTTCPLTPAEAAQKNDNDNDNCHQLNYAPAYFDGGLVEMTVRGEHHIASTRNNVFSVASHKATIIVNMRRIKWWEAIVVLLALVLAGFCILQCARAAYAYTNPTSDLFSRKRRPFLLKAPFMRWAVQKKEEERRAFKKALQEAWKEQCANNYAISAKRPVAPPAGNGAQNGKGAPNGKGVAKRRDPEDGKERTMEELKTFYKGKYSLQECEEYWEYCTPVLEPVSAEENADMAKPPDWLDLAKKNQEPSFWDRCLKRCWCIGCLRRSGAGWCSCFREENMFTCIYVGINVMTAVIGFSRNFDGGCNKWFTMAKTGGYLLDFNLAVILVPTMRTVHSCVRPVHALDGLFNEDPILFHIYCAGMVAFSVLLHVTGHVVHMTFQINSPRYMPALTTRQKMSGMQPWEILFNNDNRWAGFTGILISYLMLPMFMTALSHVRRRTFDFRKCPTTIREMKGWILLFGVGLLYVPFWFPWMIYRCIMRRTLQAVLPGEKGKLGGFQVFWTIHKNWKPCFLLLLVHGPNCWVWFMWPLAMLICDRLIRYERRKITVHLLSAELLNGTVLKLMFHPPNGFLYQAGTYLLLNCNQVNGEEWHPFTISSAPEENFVSVHIRCPNELDWCSALRRRLVEQPATQISKGGVDSKSFRSKRVKVIYSPYQSEAIFDPYSENAVAARDNQDICLSRPWRVEVTDKDSNISSFQMSYDDQKQADHERVTALMDKDMMNKETSLRTAADAEEVGKADKVEKAKLRQTQTALSLTDLIRPQIPSDVVQMGIDGPHGAPSELVWRHKVVVLVGAGIGVTPFASILRSVSLRVPTRGELRAGPMGIRKTLMNKTPSVKSVKKQGSFIKSMGGVAPKADGPYNSADDGELIAWRPCENVHFYWLCRSQDEFEWFYGLLVTAVSQASAKNQVEVNLFKTGETELSTAKSLGPQFREFFGRPNWNRIFPKLAEAYPDEHVGVFFCGPPPVRSELSGACRKATDTNTHGTRFTLHAENF